MIETIVKWALVAAVVAGVIFGIVHGYELWRDGKVAEGDLAGAARIQAQWNADKLLRAAATVAAVSKAREEEQNAAKKAAQGEKDANLKAAARAASDLAAARRTAALADGMSRHIADLNAGARAADMPTAAACPGEFVKQRDAAIRARDVLGSCQQEHRAMGQAADDALRAVTRQLDTALSYIAVVAPASP